MPITLRARPTCHYCGKRNGPSQNPSKFTCQYCQADNYLDEHGKITDVPSSAFASPRQYAIPLTPAFENVEGSIFCSTCQKNQYMYNAALSEYLPDPDHPEYDAFEAAIPAFRQDLERRYPTCCANCEPRVKAQLQQATYNARSDHVRRVLDRSRQRRNANTWGWRSLFINAAGLGWLVSLIMQLIWHALGSQTHHKASTSTTGLSQCFERWPVPVQCPDMFERFVGPSILLGSLCIWWNPMWQHKLQGREGRLVGLDKFYKVQGVLLALRFIIWILISDVPELVNLRSVLHTISLVLVTMVAGWSRFSIVKIYIPRVVDWSQDPAPLLHNGQYIPPTPVQTISPPNSQQAIPVDIFNTATPRGLQPWRPPTPPVDEDRMEWDPTPVSFSPSLKRVKYKTAEPTPFRGTLAAFPKSNIYNARQEAIVEQPKAIGLPAGLFDKSHGRGLGSEQRRRSEDTGLAQPKFFPQVTNADTGLENIFDTVFSLGEEPQIPKRETQTTNIGTMGQVNNTGITRESQMTPRPPVLVGRILNGVLVVGFILCNVLFTSEYALDLKLPYLGFVQEIEFLVLVLTAWETLIQMLLNFLGYSTVFITERLLGATFQLSVIRLTDRRRTNAQPLDLPRWNKLVVALLLLALVRSIYYTYFEDRVNASTPRVSAPSVRPDVASLPILPPLPTSQTQPVITAPKIVRRLSSDESIASTASIATTSTASGWKTPSRNHREELGEMKNHSNSTSYGLGGLSLQNDRFGAGNSVAGSRTRRTPARNAQRGW